MDIGETLYVTDRADFRKWLEKNHRKKKEIWLVRYKKATGKPSLDYVQAVEHALEAYRLARALSRKRLIIMALMNLCWVDWAQQNTSRLAERAEEAADQLYLALREVHHVGG